MATTRADIRNAVIRTYKRTDKNEEINEAINEVLKEISVVIQPRTLQDRRWVPTVAGVYEYPVPDDVLAIQHPIVLADPSTDSGAGSFQLTQLSKEKYDEHEPFPEASAPNRAKPWAYTIWEHCILLTSVPDKAYRLYMNLGKETATLNADVDTMFLQDTWLETVKAGVLARAYTWIKQYDEVKVWRDIYMNGHINDGGSLVGGLKALKRSEDSVKKAPLIVRNNPL